MMLLSGCLSACTMSVPVFSYGAMIPYIYSYLWMNVWASFLLSMGHIRLEQAEL